MIHGNDELFAGLDVSMNQTSLCLVDSGGDVIWRGACATDLESLAATIRRVGADRSTRIGLETGSLSPWLVPGLTEADLCILAVSNGDLVNCKISDWLRRSV